MLFAGQIFVHKKGDSLLYLTRAYKDHFFPKIKDHVLKHESGPYNDGGLYQIHCFVYLTTMQFEYSPYYWCAVHTVKMNIITVFRLL